MTKFYMDAHMHFDLYKNRNDVLDYIEENKSYTIAVTNLPILYEKYNKAYSNLRYTKIALGFHPELAYEYKEQISLFKKYISTTRYIGEIGLDYYHKNEDDKNVQQDIFKQIVEICATEGNKILSVHTRNAEKDCLKYLSGFNGKVIFHWYIGNLSTLHIAIDRGYFFSINHQMIKSSNGKKIIAELPIDKILLESDAPFTIGLKDNYNLDFSNKIIEYLANIHRFDETSIKNQIKNNFRAVLSLWHWSYRYEFLLMSIIV